MQGAIKRRLWLAVALLPVIIGAMVLPTGPLEAADDQAEAGRTVRRIDGYPNCGLDEQPHGWVWFEGDVRLGSSPTRMFEFEGVIYTSHNNTCAGAAACLAHAPERAGKLPTILGTSRGETLHGTSRPDLIIGGGGSDTMTGRGGADLICADGGADRVDGGPGKDLTSGGEGNNVLRGGGNQDTLLGAAGVDVLFGGRSADILDGAADDDGLYGEGGADSMRGGSGENGCFGGKGADSFADCRVAGQGDTSYGTPAFILFDIEIEPATGVDVDQFAAEVDRTLGDTRSWTGNGRTGFRRVAAGGSMHIILATPATVDRLCAPLNTGGYYSCRRGSKVILNVNRWNGATAWWPASLKTYRRYLINHEIGHYLGYGHVPCPGPGRIAPVMTQQTISLGGCVANGWPYP